MNKQRCCQFCKKHLPPGTSFYQCKTSIISGFDGYLQNQPESSLANMVQAVLKETEAKSSDALMEEVYQEFRFILCPGCRLFFRDRLQAMLSAKGKILPFVKEKGKDNDAG